MTQLAYNEHASPLFRMIIIRKNKDIYDLQINGRKSDAVHRNLPSQKDISKETLKVILIV